MLEARKRGRWIAMIAVTGAVVAAAVLGAVALGAIPDNGGVIHGCFKTNGGDLRVIDDSTSSCRSSETPLDWS
jgi:hypothetical protein